MPLTVYSVTPPFLTDVNAQSELYRERLCATAQSAEQAGLQGLLVPHNLHDLDPWLLASHIGAVTNSQSPLVAVQPACIPPHTAAAFAAAFISLYGRPLHINLVAGARDDEMRMIGDHLTHNERYDRLHQYAIILRDLLQGAEISVADGYYHFDRFRLNPRPDALEKTQIFIAGSSTASLTVASEVADVIVTHPPPFDEWYKHANNIRASGFTGDLAIRIGIICRPSSTEAWNLANQRFPATLRGRQETLLKTRSPNIWARRLAELALKEEEQEQNSRRSTYWLGAFCSGLASAPYFVGSYQDIAEALKPYLAANVKCVLLSGLEDEDHSHISLALSAAEEASRDSYLNSSVEPIQ